MIHRRLSPMILLALVLLPVLVAGRPAEAPEPVPAGPDPVTEALVPLADPVAAPGGEHLSPMMREIRAFWIEQEAKVDDLRVRADAATSEIDALALQREIEATLRETEIGILEIQAGFARTEGRIEQALAIEAAIAEMTAPPEVGPRPERRAGDHGPATPPTEDDPR